MYVCDRHACVPVYAMPYLHTPHGYQCVPGHTCTWTTQSCFRTWHRCRDRRHMDNAALECIRQYLLKEKEQAGRRRRSARLQETSFSEVWKTNRQTLFNGSIVKNIQRNSRFFLFFFLALCHSLKIILKELDLGSFFTIACWCDAVLLVSGATLALVGAKSVVALHEGSTRTAFAFIHILNATHTQKITGVN